MVCPSGSGSPLLLADDTINPSAGVPANWKSTLEDFNNENKSRHHIVASQSYYYTNMAASYSSDEIGCPYTWIPLCTMRFDNPLTNVTSGWTGCNQYTLTKDVLSSCYNAPSSTISVASGSIIRDAEEYVVPFDMSTNLLYYKGLGNSRSKIDGTIKNDDEVIIINARKMYSTPNKMDKKPMNSVLDFDFSAFENTELVLTALIKGNKNTLRNVLEEVQVYSNKNFEYFDYTGSKIDEDSFNDEDLKLCRYIELDGDGQQYKLFKLNDGVVFSTIENINIPLTPEIYSGSSIIREETINVPFKLSMKFNDLIFQQSCREPEEFDNIIDITYDRRIFPSTLISGFISDTNVDSAYPDVPLSSRIGFGAPSSIYTLTSEMGGWGHTEEYYVITSDISGFSEPSSSFGGSAYFNDWYNMNMLSQTPNKWKDYKQETEFSKLLAYPDYSPTNYIIGTPYLNEEKKLPIRESENEKLASVVKVATDIRSVNNIEAISSVKNIVPFPSSLMEVPSLSTNQSEDPNIINVDIECTSINYYDTTINNIGLFDIVIAHTEAPDLHPTKISVYFDGLPGKKDVYIRFNQNNDYGYYNDRQILGETNEGLINFNDHNIEITRNENNRLVLSGSIKFYLGSSGNFNATKMVQLHNFKLPAPSIKSIGVSYFNDQLNNLNYDGYYTISDNIWQKQILLYEDNRTGAEIYYNLRDYFSEDSENRFRLHSSLTSKDAISGSSNVLVDDEGNISGLLLTLKIPGIKKFKSASSKKIFENPKYITLSSEQMLLDYNKLGQILSGDSEIYNTSAYIGCQVMSGNLVSVYNYIETQPMTGSISIGKLRYVYNPIDDDKFQLEVIVKDSGNSSFKKSLYYVNKDVDKWYNLALYKTLIPGEDINSKSNQKFGFLLNEVDEEKLENIDYKSGEIFRCFVSNESHLDGLTVNCDLRGAALSGWNTTLFPNSSLMKNYEALYDIDFNDCMRAFWNPHYTNDPTYLTYSSETSNDDYEDGNRKNRDLFKISDTLQNGFKNPSSIIKLFANAELNDILTNNIEASTTGIIDSDENPPFYNMYVSSGFTTGYSSKNASENEKINYFKENHIGGLYGTDLSSDDDAIIKLRERLIGYTPRKVLDHSNSDNFILRKKTIEELRPHISSCEIMAKNIMFVSTPDLTYESTDNNAVTYVESRNESLGAVNDYKEFFENAQHRLPPVTYQQKLLNSDYATFVYNSCIKQDAIIYSSDKINENQAIKYDYTDNPSKIAYIWGNSKITRTETMNHGSNSNGEYVSRLHWNKAAFNEYTSEVGSIYNFTDYQHVTNSISIEVGSINERHCVLMPVTSNPLEYENRMNGEGVIKVVDNIIATTALGYNELGYPKNGILSYNTNGSVYIDSSCRNYIYIEQQGYSSSCELGATTQKPIFVESISENTQSLHELYSFLPDPKVSEYNENTSAIDDSVYAIKGDYVKGDVDDLILFVRGTTNKNHLSSNENIPIIKTTASMDGGLLLYNHKDDTIGRLGNDEISVQYFINTLALLSTKYVDGINGEMFNVFYNELNYDTLIDDSKGVDVTTTLTTETCFGYDGKLLSSNVNNGDNNGFTEKCSQIDNYKNDHPELSSYIDYTLYSPSMAVIWGDANHVTTIGYRSSLNKSNTLKKYPVYMSNFYGVNLSCVKFKILEEDIKSAPTYIRIELLRYDSDTLDFKWEHEESFDFNITETFESVYNHNKGDVYVEHTFIDDGRKLNENVFGIKFMIKSIVPQNNTYNSCKIANIHIYASNYLNKYGSSKSVNDIYVRKVDSNYDSSYKIKCSEYIWRLPNTLAEWESISGAIFKLNENNDNFNSQVSVDFKDYMQGMIDAINKNSTISDQLNTEMFDIISYYISNYQNQDVEISEILSDNYLVDSNIQISWKYVDYVYIYYSCYSFNATELLDMYFGDNIFNAVKAKLINNMKNLNANSAYSNKFKFSGGVAVTKDMALNEKSHTSIFQWKSDVRTDQIDNYVDTYQTDYTKTVTTYLGATSYRFHQSYHNSSETKYATESIYYGTSTNELLESQTNIIDTKKVGTSSTSEYLGSTLQNTKYMTVDNWTKSFSPRQIKFKIN